MRTAHVIGEHAGQLLNVLGPTLELLTDPTDPAAVYTVMRGTIPPGVSVPLHSHPDDPESFLVLSGKGQALVQRRDRLEWQDVKPGDFVHIPAGVKHAHRNPSNAPLVELVISTPNLGRFFLEVGEPVTGGAVAAPPRPEEVRRFVQVAEKYHHWMASPEENAAVGIRLP
jgi:quercetin dioxygenase-like cupin family protein